MQAWHTSPSLEVGSLPVLMCAPCIVQDEMIAYVRRKSAAFSRGRSKYRGVSGQAGRWEARIGAYCGRKNVSPVFVTKCATSMTLGIMGNSKSYMLQSRYIFMMLVASMP